MSRAFVKEHDVDTVEHLPDRPVSEHPNIVTDQGVAQIDTALAEARVVYAAARLRPSGHRSAPREAPVGPVVKSNLYENPRQDSGDDPETVHLGVTPKSRKVPVLAIHVLPPV